MKICRDVDCPNCGWPETYYEVDEPRLVSVSAIGCSKCGWSNPVGRDANARRS